MSDTKYKDWSNKATCIVCYWVRGDEDLSSFVIHLAEKNKWKAAEKLKKMIEKMIYSETDGLAMDLLQEILTQVNWGEVVDNLKE